jgi:hypothetical protein
MSRLRITVAALSLALSAMAHQAYAGVEDKDVAKMISLGGACVSCELSGRKLTGARSPAPITPRPT